MDWVTKTARLRRRDEFRMDRPELIALFGLESEKFDAFVVRLHRWAQRVAAAESAPAALRAVEQGAELLILGPDADAELIEGLAEMALRRSPRLAIVAAGVPAGRIELAARLGRLGVADCFSAASEPLESSMERVEAAWNAARHTRGVFPELVGSSRAMRRVCDLIELIAPRQSTVLITGRTGAGKEVAARAVHNRSTRANGPWVPVNCGAIPAGLLESELFGHVRGAFTGAVQQRIGRFEQAQHGTIFLDEVGELPLEMQAKLLRALQEREIQRIGSSETLRLDVRVIAATNRDLEELVARGEFREDLYYRLNVVPIRLPDLVERPDDIPALVAHFLDRICRREGLERKRVAPETLDRLAAASWPGNVRQLENAVEQAVALSGERPVLSAADFPLPEPTSLARRRAPEVVLPSQGLDYDAAVAAFERNLLEQALARSAGNKARAAELLRIKRTTFAARWKTLEDRPSLPVN